MADDGYGYYFTGGTKGKYYRIYYYDAGCEQAVPLCSKVNCSHKGEDCDAYYTADSAITGISGIRTVIYSGLNMIQRQGI